MQSMYSLKLGNFKVNIDKNYAQSCGKILLGFLLGYPIGLILYLIFEWLK